MDNRGDEKPNDLEIASIGSLYVGRWDKKYWSCSRGKDRYPYPVGYHAIRTYAGNICQTEICEGLKGPLFVITAVDGSSFSGQTPDIAWENFQKNCPRVKNWNGKRFSNKIDGAEFFGFKNPSIQRLLREVVNMTQGINLISPFICNGSKNKDQIHPQVSDRYSSLASALEVKRSCGKGIQRKRSARKDTREARPKKIYPHGLKSDSKTCTLEQIDSLCSLSPDRKVMQLKRQQFVSHGEGSANKHIASQHSSSPNGIFSPIMHQKPSDFQCPKETEIMSFANDNIIEETSLMLRGQPEVNCHSVLASDKISMGLDCSDSVVDKHIVSQQNNCVDNDTCKFATGLDNINNAVKIMLDRCPDGVNVRSDLASAAPKGDCGELMALVSFSDVYISDSCDNIIDTNCNGTSSDVSDVAIPIEIPSCMKNELVAFKPSSSASKSHSMEVVSKSEFKGLTSRNIPCGSEPRYLMPKDDFYSGCILEDGIYEGVAKDSLPEVGSSGSSGRSFEDVDLNLAGQELAKSMMTFLLPQAVPLLKKTYVRRRSREKILEANDPCCTLTDGNSADPNTVNDHLNNIIRQGTDFNATEIPILLGKHGLGELVAGTLAQLPEKTIKESIDVSKTLSPVCSSCDFNSFNLHLANEPFSGSRSSKDHKFVISDSFENDMNSYWASMQEQSCMGFDESEIAPQNDVKGNSDTSSLRVTNVNEFDELLKCFSQNDACNPEVLTPGSKNGLADSTITGIEPAKHIPLAEETNAEFIKNVVKNSNHLTENLCSLDAAYVMQTSSLHFNHEFKENAEEVSFQVALRKNTNLGENFDQNIPALCHFLDNAIDDEVSKKVIIESHNTFGSTKEKHGRCSPIEVVSFGMHEINKGEPLSEKENHSSPCMPQDMLLSSVQCNTLSETVFCQNLKNYNVPEMNSARKSLFADSRMLALYEVDTAEPEINLKNISNASKLEASWLVTAAEAFQSQDVDKNVEGIIEVPQANCSLLCFNEDSMDGVSRFSMPGACSFLGVKEGIKEISERNKTFSHSQLQPSYKNHPLMENLPCSKKNSVLQTTDNNDHKKKYHDEIYKRSLFDGSLATSLSWNKGEKHNMELVGCFLHPEPVLSIMLTASGNQLQLCVLCGFPDGNSRHIFMYVVSIQKQKRDCPSFLGYTPLLLTSVRNRWNRNIPFERSSLQLTPDGQSLIFVNSIKVPRCREQNFSCLCSNCKSESSKETALEIVHVKFGYVSRMTKLTTGEGISCISVCKPNYLVAVEENGGLHVWVMNLMWSDSLEEFMLPAFDHKSPVILELKRVPNYNSLIIGHNGIGDFGIWEISKRVLLAKFSSPGSTVLQIIPISMFNWQMNATFSTTQSAEHIPESMQKTNCEVSLVSSFKDLSIWILISTAPDLETVLEGKGIGTSSAGLWRLALMTKEMIIMGNILDPRATAIDASADSGIIGTSDGFLYKWELSSGRKLENLSSIQCGVSCVALDSKSGALAAAGKDGKLQVFIER